MFKSISINGVAVVTRDENQRVKFIQFLPDDELAPVLEQGCKISGQLQLLRNAAFDYVANMPQKLMQQKRAQQCAAYPQG